MLLIVQPLLIVKWLLTLVERPVHETCTIMIDSLEPTQPSNENDDYGSHYTGKGNNRDSHYVSQGMKIGLHLFYFVFLM